MTKKIVSASMAISAVLALSGCGSSSSTPTTATGTAYYVDSAVSGVNYKCGTTEGITGTDGEFTFEVGASCIFYLGDIELRSVDAELLVDGGDVQETDIEIARILQSLDSDGNPDNGITINAEIVQALENAGITKLPDTQAEMDEMLAVVEAAGGTVVSEADAAEHLLTNLIVGKTLYQHWSDGENDQIATLTFGTDGKLVMVDGDETETVTYRIEGNVIYTMEEEGEEAHPVAEITDEYIRINETSGSVTTFYFTHEAAEAAPAMTDNGSDNGEAFTSFSTDYLNGKTYYYVQYDDFGYDDMKWNMARINFTTNTFTWTEYDTEDSGTHTFHYTVDSDGNIVYYYDNPDETTTIGSPMPTNDYIKVCEDGDCNTYLFFDETKARAFRDSKNDSLVPSEFTQEVVSANPWYRVEYGVENGVDVAYCNGVFTYDGNNNLTASWNDNGVAGSATGTYSIVDGKVVVPHDGKTETETLLTFENSVITTDSVTVQDDSTYSGNVKWFKNQTDAENFLNTYGESSCF